MNDTVRYLDLDGGRTILAEAPDDPEAYLHAGPGDVVVLNPGDGNIRYTTIREPRATLAVVLAVPPASGGILYALAQRKFGYGRSGHIELPGRWSCLPRVDYAPNVERIRLMIAPAGPDGAEVAQRVFAVALGQPRGDARGNVDVPSCPDGSIEA